MSLFDAEVVTKLSVAGYAIAGKAAVGEFAFDLMGESASDGACVRDGKLCTMKLIRPPFLRKEI